MTRTVLLLLGLLALVCVCFWLSAKNAELRAENAKLKQVYAEAKAAAVAASAKANNDALIVREETYAKVTEAGIEAAVSIATAKREPETTNEVNPDGYLPLSLSDVLIMQQDRICSGFGLHQASVTDL